MTNDIGGRMAEILNLCERNPDEGLQLINQTLDSNPALARDPFAHFAKAMALGSKGLFQSLRANPGIELVKSTEGHIRDNLDLSEEKLDFLEDALRAIRVMEDETPGALPTFFTDNTGERKVDALCMALDKCRPGQVQRILGKTKLLFFVPDRVLFPPNVDTSFCSEAFDNYFATWFTHRTIVRTATVIPGGTDNAGRNYIHVMLFRKSKDQWRQGEAIGESLEFEGGLYIFSDGTYSDSEPETDPTESEMPQRETRGGLLRRFFSGGGR